MLFVHSSPMKEMCVFSFVWGLLASLPVTYPTDIYLFLFEFLLHLILERHCRYQNSNMDQEPSQLPKELYKMLLISLTLICPKKCQGGLHLHHLPSIFTKLFGGYLHPCRLRIRHISICYLNFCYI